MSNLTVGTIMVDCRDLDVMVDFWGSLLGIEKKATYPQYVWIGRIAENGPALAFQKVPEAKTGKNRVHLDMHAPDVAAAVTRVEALGGSRVANHSSGDFHWTICADPEGNEFCIAPEG